MERYGEVKRSGMLEGRMQLEKSLMLWKSSVNTYRIPDEVHDWFTRGQGNWGVSIWLPTRYLCAFVLTLNSCCTAPFSACSGWYE